MKSILFFLFLVLSHIASAQSNICFQRAHGGFAEILIPVNQWHDSSVIVKAFDTIGQNAGGPVSFNTANLPKVTSTGGVQYYYIKTASPYSTIDLIFEVSSTLDAAVT
ncbi:hypothetical protein DBR32_12865, partial [Taibaiella sp. KBW10]|uniref:hypothetical protein n=1 Tax=Taibaiella sp. KBW10 TaxID=2153357 RepID=UPI000F99BF03